MTMGQESKKSSVNQLEKDAMIQSARQKNLQKFKDSLNSMSEMDILHDDLKKLEEEEKKSGIIYGNPDVEIEAPTTVKDDYLKEHWQMKENKALQEEFKTKESNEKYQTPEF